MTADNHQLIKIDDLTGLKQPASIFVERVSDAVGGFFRPWQIKRVAKARAEEKLIQAKVNIEVSAMEKRAMNRLLSEEIDKQENIESITVKAIPHLTEHAKPNELEKDWLVNFFDKARLISDS